MAQIINLSIDLTKVDKSKIKEVQLKSGKTAKYLNLTMFVNDEQDQYGNIASLSLQQTEEQRTAKTPKTYVGNGKRIWADNGKPKPESEGNNTSANNDDLPF